MKRAILLYRLPHLLLGGLITGILVASAVVLPAPPAHAANQYLIDLSISEDLSFQQSFFIGEKKNFSEKYKTEDSNKICEKLKSKKQQYLKPDKKDSGIINQKVDTCRFQGSLFFIEISGKIDEKLLKNSTSMSRLKIKNEDEFEFEPYIPFSAQSNDLKIAEKENVGIARYTFPGKIKRVTPDIGKISGTTWSLDKPLTSEERDKLERSDGKITITAERYGSKLGLILGIIIPAVLIIAAVIVLLIVRSNRKKKQQNLPAYPAGSSTYPPSPYLPGNSGQPSQPPIPGYPNAPGTAHTPNGQPPIPGATQSPMSSAPTPGGYPPQYGNFPPVPYPPKTPHGQAGAPAQGGYYPYPYPPANPQNLAGGQPPMPNQGYGYGAPTPGFPVPPKPPEAGAPRDPGKASTAKHIANSTPSEQSDKPNGPKHAANPGDSGQAGPA